MLFETCGFVQLTSTGQQQNHNTHEIRFSPNLKEILGVFVNNIQHRIHATFDAYQISFSVYGACFNFNVCPKTKFYICN